uniref:Uncharacterized protein n=1 Tax=Amphimedon queenslandica TaxID=400682 RepID=A0A1X7V4Z6_AMPQE
QLILAHFPIDNSLALVKKSSFIDKNAVISIGSEHQVKEGSKVYTAKIIEIGDDEAIKIAEDKFYAADDENEVSKESYNNQRTLCQDASIIKVEKNSCSVVHESAFAKARMALDK